MNKQELLQKKGDKQRLSPFLLLTLKFYLTSYALSFIYSRLMNGARLMLSEAAVALGIEAEEDGEQNGESPQ